LGLPITQCRERPLSSGEFVYLNVSKWPNTHGTKINTLPAMKAVGTVGKSDDSSFNVNQSK